MRCPKCSFISYDQVETCVKCGKNISGAAEQLHGTTVNVPAPGFLKFEAEEPETQYESGAEDVEETVDLGTGKDDFVDLSMEGDESQEIEFQADEVELDMGIEEAEEEEPVIDFSAEESEESIDLSDLAPSDDVEQETVEVIEEEIEEAVEDEYVEEPLAEETVSGEAVQEGQGLKDLKVDIDLDETETPKGKVMPSVKTGTALDDFDIDLGDLLTSKKK